MYCCSQKPGLNHFTRSTGNLAAAALRDQYEPLLTAIKRGDWDAATNFLSLNEDAKSARISKDGGTVLHAAVAAGRTVIVEKLVDLMSAEELEITDDGGSTALAVAIMLENTQILDCILRKNSNLLNIPSGSDNCIPLLTYLLAGNLKLARHLYSVYLPHQKAGSMPVSFISVYYLLSLPLFCFLS